MKKYEKIEILKGNNNSKKIIEAIQSETQKRVILKKFDKHFVIQDEFLQKCLSSEIEILSLIEHKNVISLEDVLQDINSLFVVCKKYQGIPLNQAICMQKKQRFAEEDAKKIFRDIVEGVNYLHENNIAHRDLKLDNILIDDNTCTIMDLGLSEKVGQHNPEEQDFCGTPSYCSPEIILQNNYRGKESDIWALGVILYQMLTNSLPFRGSS